MKKRDFLAHILLATVMTYCAPSSAENLLQVYQQALDNDPTYAQARADWHSAEMSLPIARSQYLPQLTILSSGSRNYSFIRPITISTIRDYFWRYGYTVTLSQPIFALSTWESIKEASASVKAATATFLAAQQNLMARTTQAYFNVLKQYNILRYTVANKKAVLRQYESAKETYKAGLIAITDVYDAKSRFDNITTREITAENDLDIALERLRAITGHYYTYISGLKTPVPLNIPKPNNIDTWTRVAQRDNYNIQAQNFNVTSSMRKIKRVAAGDVPTLSLEGSYSETQNSANSGNRTINDTAGLKLDLSYRPIQGGFVRYSTKQAEFDYAAQSELLEKTHRDVVESTRSSFLSIISGIRRIKSDRISITSSEKALEATQEGLRVGTRTMVDVLDDLTDVYLNKQQYADDQYNYLNSIIQLKNASGRLSIKDIVSINKNLKNPIKIPVAHRNKIDP